MSDERAAESPQPADPTSGAAMPAAPREHLLLQQAGDVIENLRSQMTELDRREQNLTTQTAALENERRRLRLSAQEFEEQIQHREERIRAQEQAAVDLTAKLEQQRIELETRQQELNEQIETRNAERERGLASIDEELAAERLSRRSAMEAELKELAGTVTRERERWETEASQRQAKFAADEDEHQQKLTALRSELEALREEQLGEIERREGNLQRKQVELEKRTRFHETHLNQLRRTVEQQQAECDRSHQLARAGQVQQAEQLDRYRHQLLSVRDRLTQREESIDLERQLIDDLRRSLTSQSRQELERCQQDRQVWEEERDAHLADIRRQQDMLALHAQNLEARRSRLDQLRDDLEQTHRETLEVRLVVEQVWAELSQTFGEETTRQRVEQARVELSDGYDQLRTSLAEQRMEIDAAEQRLTEQRKRFRAEREEFTAWMSKHELQLQQREELLQRDIQLAAERDAEWRTTRERWTLEKIEAESVIRQLLEELDADLTRPTIPQPQIGPETEESTSVAA